MNIQNPVIHNSQGGTADPFVTFENGYFYHCFSDGKNGICVSRFTSLEHMGDDTKREIFSVYNAEGLERFFAPELHKLDGKWYIYAAPNKIGDPIHFMCVLESEGLDPVGKYNLLGTIDGIGEKWSIDATTFMYREQRYMFYTDCKNIFLAKMSAPDKLDGESVVITTPEYDWEKEMQPIVEGPAVIFDKDTPVLIYSASDSKCDGYCLGMMRLEGDDPMKKDAWVKHPHPILSQKEGMFGPGHCSFSVEDGNLYCIFHANLESGTGNLGRSVFIKRVHFENGILIFE